MEKTWDFFISHASEDKEEIAKPLAEFLRALGFKIWYDEFELKLGDSLNQSINKGLAESKIGIVILSPNFFAKSWPQRELNGFVAVGQRILPVLHNMDYSDVARKFPVMADIKAIKTHSSIMDIVREILRSVEGEIPLPSHLPSPVYDIIFPDDVKDALKEVDEFKEREFTDEELGDLYHIFFISRVQTREKLKAITTNKKLVTALRKLYQDELSRPFEPSEFALGSSYLVLHGFSSLSLNSWKKNIHKSNEYRKKHNLQPLPTILLQRIRQGKELVSMILEADSLILNHDNIETSDEAELIGNFERDFEDWDIAINIQDKSLNAYTEFDFTQRISELEKLGFYLYAAITNGKYTTSHTTISNWKNLYITISRRELESLICIVDPDR